MDNEKKIPIETALSQLEELISRLESRDCTLEESFHLYKQGIELIQYCGQELTQVQKQLIILNEGGTLDGV